MFENFSRDQNLKLLSIVIMSDGSINFRSPGVPHSLRLSTLDSSKNQHRMFSVLSEKVFEKKPSIKHKLNYLISNLFSVKAIKEILELSPTFKTSPSFNQSISAYLALKQPTLGFLFNESEEIKWVAFRMYFDFDGSISPVFKLRKKRDVKNSKSYTYYQMQFECELQIAETNPSLVTDLLKICGDLGLRARIKEDKRNWSKIGGIKISHLNSVRKFLQFGPMTDVKISLKSRNLTGVTKRAVVNAVSNFLNSGNRLSKYFNNKNDALKYKNSIMSNFLKTIERAP